MIKAMRRRFVGASIFVALAVIFFPILFSPQNAPQQSLHKELTPPQLQSFVIENPNKVKDISDVGSYQETLHETVVTGVAQPLLDQPKSVIKAQASIGPLAEKGAQPSSDQAILDPQGLPIAWTIQVASFADKANAIAVNDKLQASEFHSYIKAFQVDGQKRWRVFVGPLNNKVSVKNQAKRLAEVHQFSGIVVRFVP